MLYRGLYVSREKHFFAFKKYIRQRNKNIKNNEIPQQHKDEIFPFSSMEKIEYGYKSDKKNT